MLWDGFEKNMTRGINRTFEKEFSASRIDIKAVGWHRMEKIKRGYGRLKILDNLLGCFKGNWFFLGNLEMFSWWLRLGIMVDGFFSFWGFVFSLVLRHFLQRAIGDQSECQTHKGWWMTSSALRATVRLNQPSLLGFRGLFIEAFGPIIFFLEMTFTITNKITF